MIVVEGPDGAGKTTLIEKISRELDIPVADRVVGKDTKAMVDLKQWTELNTAQGFRRIIYDRHRLISEPIYGPILRDEPEPGFNELLWLTRVMRRFYSCKPVLIYCLPPWQTVLSNVLHDRDNDNSAVEARISRIYSAYIARASIDTVHHFNTMIYDYTVHEAAPVVDRVRTYLNARRLHESPI